jgi:glycosidase
MRTHDDYKEINVASQIKDPKSVLYFWKNMITVRKEYKELFVHREFEEFQMQDESTFIFSKKHGRARAVVALNFTSEEQIGISRRLGASGNSLWVISKAATVLGLCFSRGTDGFIWRTDHSVCWYLLLRYF